MVFAQSYSKDKNNHSCYSNNRCIQVYAIAVLTKFLKNQNSPSKNVFAEKTSHPWIIEFQFKKS